MLKMKGPIVLLIMLVSLATTRVAGQSFIEWKIEWGKTEEVLFENEKYLVPTINKHIFNHFDPQLKFTRKVSNKNTYSLSLENILSVNASSEDINYIEKVDLSLPNEAQIDFKTANAGREKFITASVMPFYKENGQIKKITSFTINYTSSPAAEEIPAKDFASSSVLAEGTWYKIAVSENGIYKVDYDFMQSCGFSVSSLASSSIHLYGNGEGVLPVDNDAPRTDDLASNAILMQDGGDGVFGPGDFFLFYGRGPHQFSSTLTNNLYVRNTNSNATESNYFIHVDANKPANRIQNQASSSLSPNTTATHFDHVEHHEVETKNLMKGGQRWYGEMFDSQLSYSFNFPFLDIDPTADLNVRLAIASNPRNDGSTFEIDVNGTNLKTLSISKIGADYRRLVELLTTTSSQENIRVDLTMNRSTPDVLTYLDYITVQGRRRLRARGTNTLFRDFQTVGSGNITRFNIENGANYSIWEITDWQNPKRQLGTSSGSDFEFVVPTDSLRSFLAFNSASYQVPTRIGSVANQNLHGLAQADYIIVTPKQFREQAIRLANLHRSKGLVVHVVTQQQVFNEFSSGMPDPIAIRSLLKMFYDRGQQSGGLLPKYLLLFGDGIYDNRGLTSSQNYLLTYQVANSENHISALVADDFFGFLDDNEGYNLTDLLDVGIGRLLVSSTKIADEQVDKIEHYMNNGSEFFTDPGDCDCPLDKTRSTFGDWRMRYVQIADDEQSGGVFVTTDTEPQVDIVEGYRKEMNVDKIYLDAYEQITTAGGQRYPGVNEAINDRIRRGSLVMNYVGHGGEVGVAEERVITVPQIQAWKNSAALPLIVSATCEFTKFDDPDRVSAGEWVSLNPKGGAIALMTTTRSVFISVNTQVMKSFFREVFQRNEDSLALTFGEIIQNTKNGTGTVSDNSRCFTLIGDPGLRIALPQHKVVLDSIRREGSTALMDTVRALDKITVVGHMEDLFGNALNTFNGVASPTLYDKPKTFFTLGQDDESDVLPFELQKNALYKGQATVKNGRFEMTFIVPKDIDYKLGFGKLSMYADNDVEDAMGYNDTVVVGGINPDGLDDDRGPDIELYMNDYTFVNGGLTNESPMFIAKLFDENGINAVGNGIGHDLTAVLDEETGNPIVMNEYYLADLDTYQSGEVRYRLNDLEPGRHTITFKAWDVNNNSSATTLEFEVQEEALPTLNHVLNYPNPFTTKTEFFFEHNQVNTPLQTQIQIFTISGRLVKTLNQLVTTSGFRSAGIEWDGRDDFGDQLAKGVYVYRVSVETPGGEKADAWEKLVILK